MNLGKRGCCGAPFFHIEASEIRTGCATLFSEIWTVAWFAAQIFCGRNRQREASPLPSCAFDRQIAVHRARYAAGDVEPQARSPVPAPPETLELFEYLGLLILVDAMALIRASAVNASARLQFARIAFGAAGYGWLGDWQAIEKTGMPNIDQMMAGLKARVQAHPEDRSARLLLAQAQRRQGDNAGAATNFHILNQRSAAPPNTDLIAAEAQARLAAGGDLAGRAGDLYSRLLKLDPNNREALWYLGLRAAEAGRNTKAIHFWDRLLEQHLSTEARAMISSRRRSLLQNKSDP